MENQTFKKLPAPPFPPLTQPQNRTSPKYRRQLPSLKRHFKMHSLPHVGKRRRRIYDNDSEI